MAKICKVLRGINIPVNCQFYAKVMDERIHPSRKIFEASVIVHDDRLLLTEKDRRRLSDLFVDIISSKDEDVEDLHCTIISYAED